MRHFLRNNKRLVIPGIESNSYYAFEVDVAYYETPYGLALPTTGKSATMLRFLRNYDQLNTNTFNFAPASTKSYVCYLLNNRGEMELVFMDGEMIDKVEQFNLEVITLPAGKPTWKVEDALGPTDAIAKSDAVKKMSQAAAVKWLDEHSGHRFQQPFTVDIETWVKNRPPEYKNLLLHNNAFIRGDFVKRKHS